MTEIIPPSKKCCFCNYQFFHEDNAEYVQWEMPATNRTGPMYQALCETMGGNEPQKITNDKILFMIPAQSFRQTGIKNVESIWNKLHSKMRELYRKKFRNK
jgi:hypothetical protein